MNHLIVTVPFLDYEKGQLITDPKLVKSLLDEHHDKVVQVAPVAAVGAKE
jgi:hypothetical protein